MTREEAIEVIKQDIPCEYDTDLIEALDMAIQALEQEPMPTMVYPQVDGITPTVVKAEQEPSGNLISRQAVLDLAKLDERKGLGTIIHAFDVEQLPPVKPQEQKTGHWIGIDEEPHEVWECDHCGFVIDGSGCIDPYDYRDTYKFCPNCGAKMESDHTCHTCKHYMSGEYDGSCDSYICEHYSGWESEE